MKKLNFTYIFMFLLIIVIVTTSINIIGIINSSELKSKTKNSPNTSNTTETVFSRANLPVAENKRYTVVLDAGHGGKDPGSIGPKGTLEKDIAVLIPLMTEI